MEINRDLIRYLILIGSAPIWWPVAKMLWRDFNGALREEGGLLGSQPSPREVDAILAEKKGQPETLVSEPWVAPGQVRKPRMRGRGQGSVPDAGRPGRGAERPTTRRDGPRGFR